MFEQTITLTFGDVAENHVGMQEIGMKSEEGFSCEDLQRIQTEISHLVQTELVKLEDYAPAGAEKAWVLVIKNGVNFLLHYYNTNADVMYQEQQKFTPDTKYYDNRKGKVCNKQARYNLIFSEFSQLPDYENRKGTVISYADAPHVDAIRRSIPWLLKEKGVNLQCEGNYYYCDKSGIGFHGDAERRKVVGLRLGKTMPLVFQWFQHNKSVSERLLFTLNHADIYIMSDYATGYNWKSPSKITLRHAAGADKYTHWKPKK